MATASPAFAQLLQSSWATEQDRDALLAELIGKPLSPADALKLALHRDSEVAGAGLRFFAARANARAVRELIGNLAAAPSDKRERLVAVLRGAPNEFVSKAIDELLRSGELTDRRLGWNAALQLKPPLRTIFLGKAVLAAPPAMRLKALELLLQEREPEEMRPLLFKLADAEDLRLANRAFEALAQLRGDDILELMLQRFATADAQPRAVASEYLKREAKAAPELVRGAMLQGLTHRHKAVRGAAAEILFASGPPEVVVREALEYCSGLLGWLRVRVLGGLADGGPEVLAVTLELLQHPDETMRFYALTLAIAFEDPDLVEPLCQLLHDPDWWIRVTICDALARIGDDRAVPHLIGVLDDDEVRWAAIDALGRMRSGTALQPLIARLNDPREEVRIEVLQGLSKLEDERLLPVFERSRDTDVSLTVRRRANELIEALRAGLHLDGDDAGGVELEQTFDLPMQRLLCDARQRGASDLHLSAGEPPLLRIDGELRPHSETALEPSVVKELILSIMTETERGQLIKQGELDFNCELPDVGRYRGSAFLGRRGWNVNFRVIPDTAPSMERLGLPEPLFDLVNYNQGIVVFCGPTGSGKSTSLTAIVNRLNERRAMHIITLEDPIEFVHPSKAALVNQREIGVHTRDAHSGLRAALREDPDVLVLGELREAQSIRLAMEAAETGHLVLTTLHTATVTQAIERLVGAFSPEEQDHARTALAETLKFVVCQRLVPNAQPPGRTGIFELLRITPSIGHLIRKSETHQIPGLMQLGSGLGNRTLDQALLEKVEAQIIRPEDAWHHATKRALFEPLCDPAWLADRGIELP